MDLNANLFDVAGHSLSELDFCFTPPPKQLPSSYKLLGGKDMKRVAIYARVSTDKQTCENQLIELRAVAERCGYTIVTEFVDTGIVRLQMV